MGNGIRGEGKRWVGAWVAWVITEEDNGLVIIAGVVFFVGVLNEWDKDARVAQSRAVFIHIIKSIHPL